MDITIAKDTVEAMWAVLEGTATHDQLVKVLAHTLDTLPGVEVYADHIGWYNGSPSLVNERIPDVTVEVLGNVHHFEAETATSFGAHAAEQAHAFAGDASTTFVTTPDAVEKGTAYFAQHGVDVPVADPFTTFASFTTMLGSMGVSLAGSHISAEIAGAVATAVGLGPTPTGILVILTAFFGSYFARKLYQRYLQDHIQRFTDKLGRKAEKLFCEYVGEGKDYYHYKFKPAFDFVAFAAKETWKEFVREKERQKRGAKTKLGSLKRKTSTFMRKVWTWLEEFFSDRGSGYGGLSPT